MKDCFCDVCVYVCTIPDWFCLLWSRSLRLLTFTELTDSLLISPELECTVEYITSLVPYVCCWITGLHQRHVGTLLIFSDDSSKLCHKANRLLQYEVTCLPAYCGGINNHQISITILLSIIWLRRHCSFLAWVTVPLRILLIFIHCILTQIVGAISRCSWSLMKHVVYRKLNPTVIYSTIWFVAVYLSGENCIWCTTVYTGEL